MKFTELLSEMSLEKLTKEEKQIIDHLSDAYNIFITLPNKHISDNEEFTRYIHILQRHVMALATRRIHPEIFGHA